MFIIIYILITVLIGIGFVDKIDDSYSKFLTIFGMPILLWVLLGHLLRRIWFSYKLPIDY